MSKKQFGWKFFLQIEKKIAEKLNKGYQIDYIQIKTNNILKLSPLVYLGNVYI